MGGLNFICLLRMFYKPRLTHSRTLVPLAHPRTVHVVHVEEHYRCCGWGWVHPCLCARRSFVVFLHVFESTPAREQGGKDTNNSVRGLLLLPPWSGRRICRAPVAPQSAEAQSMFFLLAEAGVSSTVAGLCAGEPLDGAARDGGGRAVQDDEGE